MTAGGARIEQAPRSRERAVWFLGAGALALVAGVAIWWATTADRGDDASAAPAVSATQTAAPAVTSPTPSASEPGAATDPPTVAASAADMEGDWCVAGSDGSYGSCLWIELPRLVYEADSDNGLYLFPGDERTTQPDESTDLDGDQARLVGGCLTYGLDDWPTTGSPVHLWYCPEGATVPPDGFLADEPATADTDRLYIGITDEGALYERVDDGTSAEAAASMPAASLVDAEDTWCNTYPIAGLELGIGDECWTIALPMLVYGTDPEGESDTYIFPAGPNVTPPDASSDYSEATWYEGDGCIGYGADSWDGWSGIRVYYCPAGAGVPDDHERFADAFEDQDRLFMGSDTSAPSLRQDVLTTMTEAEVLAELGL